MRTELEQIERIEKYLRGDMGSQDKADFEKELDTNPQLKEDLELQRELVEGVERVALKQSADQAYRKYKGGSNGMSWLFGTLAVVALAGAVTWFVNRNDHPGLPELNENGAALWADADKYLTPQLFTIDSKQDTVIETEGGIVLVVPANCFLDEDGNPVEGDVELEVKEAMEPSDIMQAGLSTMSGDDLLETGGMFYINGRKGGASLKIDPNKGIHFEVPTDEKKEGMKLFQGVRKANGSINWEDAKDLDNFLVPVDMMSLDFYPSNYLSALANMGEEADNKAFTDSLYYSFAWEYLPTFLQATDVAVDSGIEVPAAPPPTSGGAKITGNTSLYPDTIITESISTGESITTLSYVRMGPPRGINPAKVKAIWSEAFQNTNLATREFEERMPLIHRSCNGAVLDLYINNLGKNLSEVDEMAVKITSGSVRAGFLKFAARNDGKVEHGNQYAFKLKAYYVKKQKALARAVAKTQRDHQQKQAKLNKVARDKQIKKSEDEMKRVADNFSKELEINMKEAYRQIGQKLTPAPVQTYSGTVRVSGWKNLDVYVLEATAKRKTLNYTAKNGKKAVIKYEKLTVSQQPERYDRLYVYLLPDSLNSFMRMRGVSGVYEENLNELFKYDLVCIGYKDDAISFGVIEDVQPNTEVSVDLLAISADSLEKKLKALKHTGQSKDLLSELAHRAFEMADRKRVKKEQDRQQLGYAIRPAIFPCDYIRTTLSESDAVPMGARIDRAPSKK
ncbi:MAG: hypothetical protein JKY52_06145 [Flavobacteriales bacterium]|nr:hypothetical protein [Flavobacteriales bacterium]